MKKLLLALAALFAVQYVLADEKLTGRAIGTELCYDYSTGRSTTTVNTPANAFDGDFNTFVATNARSNTWAGLDLGTPHVITRVGWAARNDGTGPQRCVLGLFEGANDPTFADAVPLYLIDEEGIIGSMKYAPVHVSRGFRYVRYVGPHDARCNIAELEFQGHEGAGDDSRFYQVTNLPTLSFRTTNGADPISKTTELEATMTLVYDDGTLIQEYPILARSRGNASYGFDKKPYRIKFNDGESHHIMRGSNLESPAKAKKWTLINNYGDKTLMRNIVAFETSRRLGSAYTVYCQPVDVIVNGEYKGCYQLCDQITADKARVPITEMTPDDVEEPEVTGGYLVEVDAYGAGEPSMFYSRNGTPVTIKEPGSDDITPEQKAYIKQSYDEMEATLWSSRFADPTHGYRSRLDLDSFLKHFLVGEYSGNTDTYWSVYMYKDRGEDVFHVGPSWDFDLAFNNDRRTYPVCDKDDWIYHRGGSGAPGMTAFVERVMSDPYAQKRLREIWQSVRYSGIISAESMLAYVDSTARVLQASQRLNFMRWPILGVKVHENAFAYPTYEEELNVVRDYVQERVKWIDDYLAGTLIDDDYEEHEKGEHFDIQTADDLIAFAKAVNGGDRYATATLLNDIDMTAANSRFQPIGTEGRLFKGEFDGQGHRISNLVVNGTSFVGLFGAVGGGVKICNLVLDASCSISGNAFVGLVGGSNESGPVTLECLGNEGTVRATNQNAGGIIGCNMNSSAIFLITNCYASGTVAGGLESAAISGWVGNGGVIQNCFSTATVTGNEPSLFFIRGSAVTINCYDTHDTGMMNPLSDSRIQSGELCYLLNEENDGDDVVWRQNLPGLSPVDAHPVLDATHAIVHKDDMGGYFNDTGGIVPDERTDTFAIATPDELMAFATLVNQGSMKVSAILTADINLSRYKGTLTLPIGTVHSPFKGTFDGNGHTIRHLIIDLPTNDNVGLFGVVGSGAVIKNVVLDDDCRLHGQSYVGLIGTVNDRGTVIIENVGNEGEVISEAVNAGGILGCNMGSLATVNLTNCYVTGSVSGRSESAALSGWIGSKATIKGCYSLAAVEGVSEDNYLFRGEATVSNCYDLHGSNGAKKTSVREAASGQLCYYLNTRGEEVTDIWRQNLLGLSPVDSHPVLDRTHAVVVKERHGFGNVDDAIITTAEEETTDIEAVYDLNGRPITQPQDDHLYLIRYKDGRVRKVLYRVP